MMKNQINKINELNEKIESGAMPKLTPEEELFGKKLLDLEKN